MGGDGGFVGGGFAECATHPSHTLYAGACVDLGADCCVHREGCVAALTRAPAWRREDYIYTTKDLAVDLASPLVAYKVRGVARLPVPRVRAKPSVPPPTPPHLPRGCSGAAEPQPLRSGCSWGGRGVGHAGCDSGAEAGHPGAKQPSRFTQLSVLALRSAGGQLHSLSLSCTSRRCADMPHGGRYGWTPSSALRFWALRSCVSRATPRWTLISPEAKPIGRRINSDSGH